MAEPQSGSSQSAAPLPLTGVRVLAVEQMAALPFATQLLARLGATVVKVEHPKGGDSGRGAVPSITDPDGRTVGATFLRSNLGKRSIAIDLKNPKGVELVAQLAGKFDVFAENFKPGALDRMGLGYETMHARWPRLIYASLSGFGHTDGPYREWPAYASVVEAMSGIYEFKRTPQIPPRANPVGALGDISTGLFATIGMLAALRHRDVTGEGQQIDVAMYDATVAMTDIVMNFYSLGVNDEAAAGVGIIDTFAASDGHFVIQVVREHHFEALARTVGREDWLADERLSTRAGWAANVETLIRPGVEAWAAGRTKRQAAAELSAAGLAAGPSHNSADVVADPHLLARNMVVPMERPSGDGPPVLIPGNPVKMSAVPDSYSPDHPEQRVPWLGEHTDEVLTDELGLTTDELDALRTTGVIA